jgi:hypothetical protein
MPSSSSFTTAFADWYPRSPPPSRPLSSSPMSHFSGIHADSHHSDSPRRRNRKRTITERSVERYRNESQDQNDGQDSKSVEEPSPKAIRTEPRRRLACPYFKMDPTRFSKANTCVGPGWSTVYRLKEHLYRRHAPHPHQCSRCNTPFKTHADLSIHYRDSTYPCERQTQASVDDEARFTPDQEKRLRARKKHSPKTEEEKWAEVFKVLFPLENKIPSPCTYPKLSPTQVITRLSRTVR